MMMGDRLGREATWSRICPETVGFKHVDQVKKIAIHLQSDVLHGFQFAS
jgi:hypothetical protein